MIKDIQTASFFLKDGINDNSSFRWCFCPGEDGDVSEAGGLDAVTGESTIGGPETAAPDPTAPSAEKSSEASLAGAQATSEASQAAGQGRAEASSISGDFGRGDQSSVDFFDLQDTGFIGIQDPVDIATFSNLAPEQLSQIKQAKELAQKYNIEVTPPFMFDPTSPTTYAYSGPRSTQAALNEMAKGAAELGLNLVEMTPSITNLAMNIASRNFGFKNPTDSLRGSIENYFDKKASDIRTANIKDQAKTVAEQYDPSVYNRASFFVSPPKSFYDEGLPDSGGVPLAPAIPSVPTVAPEPAEEVVVAEKKPRLPSKNAIDIIQKAYNLPTEKDAIEFITSQKEFA
tara:strand:- start:479 stop:1510 length:1032 start_codon:yes stop_codon:yes gene_type:complete